MTLTSTFVWRGATYKLIPTIDGESLAIVRRATSQRAGIIPKEAEPDDPAENADARACVYLNEHGDPTRSDLAGQWLSPDLQAEVKAMADDLANAMFGDACEALAFWVEEGKYGPLGISVDQLRAEAASAYRLATADRDEDEQLRAFANGEDEAVCPECGGEGAVPYCRSGGDGEPSYRACYTCTPERQEP